MSELEHSGTACVLLGLSNGATAPLSASTEPLESLDDAKTSASGSAIKSYALLNAAKRQTQAAALPRKEWSPHEDELIRRGVEQLGCRWRVIAAQLPGRSDDAVRNRWSRLQDTVKGRANSRESGSKRGSGAEAASGEGNDEASEGDGEPSEASSTASSTGDGRGASANIAEPTSAGDASGAGSLSVDTPIGQASKGGSNGSARASDKSGTAIASSGKTVSSGGGSSSAHGSAAFRKERSSWTRVEDDVIVQGVAELGHKWFEIARRLPGRTDHAIRNRWSRLQSILLQQESHSLGHGLGSPFSSPVDTLSPTLSPQVDPPFMMPAAASSPINYMSARPAPSYMGAAARTHLSAASAFQPGMESSAKYQAVSMEAASFQPPPISPCSSAERLLPTATAEVAYAEVEPAESHPSACAAAAAAASIAAAACGAVIASARVARIDGAEEPSAETPHPTPPLPATAGQPLFIIPDGTEGKHVYRIAADGTGAGRGELAEEAALRPRQAALGGPTPASGADKASNDKDGGSDHGTGDSNGSGETSELSDDASLPEGSAELMLLCKRARV